MSTNDPESPVITISKSMTAFGKSLCQQPTHYRQSHLLIE
jgi:hypothetical protein